MNYLPVISHGVFGGSDATERANLFASWGLRISLSAAAIYALLVKMIKLAEIFLFKPTTKKL